MRYLALFVSLLILAVTGVRADGDKPEPENRKNKNAAHKKELLDNEVTFSSQVWGYYRIYPLLDGLLQDISATQVATMTINPNSPNGTSVDALQQSFQLQLQYSQLAGIQNAATAQAATANSNYQTTLAQQQSALLQQLSTAYNQVLTAQTNLTNLNASGTASSTDITIATQALTAANANLTAAGSAITNFKNLAAPSVPSPSSALVAQPTLPSLTASAIPSAVGTAATGNSGPSFPSTKQMDNQINVLWDRLARLVGAMSRPDDMGPDDTIYLVKFDTGIYPYKRDKELLEVNYEMDCGAVLDLFPRNAALNIVEDKYKDSAYGFGAVLSWFGIGGSVAYNREHLKASQLLGQSSYISGHGIGLQKFGWLYGITLGDDSISPGPRNTFALIWAPKGCNPKIKTASAHWMHPPKLRLDFPEPVIPSSAAWELTPTAAPECARACVTAVEFNRNEYDVTSGKPALITVRITLSRDMDQQQTVSVNGQFVQRVRDNFGRAISPITSGTNGVLETAQMGVNTWVPTSPRTLLLTLDSSQFGSQFPQILLNSPRNVVDIAGGLSPTSTIFVSGRPLVCDAPPCAIPSLGVAKASVKNLGVARWISRRDAAGKFVDKLSITVLDPDPLTISPSNPAVGTATVQVISDVDTPTWGSEAEVYLISSDNKMRRLRCGPQGSRLICDAPDSFQIAAPTRPPLQLQIVDQHHVGGIAIKGTIFTKECSNDESSSNSCRQPLIWTTSHPKLLGNNTSQLSGSKWRMWLQMVNVDDTDLAKLGIFDADVSNKKMVDCSKGFDQPCLLSFTFPIGLVNSVSDWMNLQISDTHGTETGPRAAITNVLTNIKPIITQISDDRKTWSGKNLVFDSIRVGNSTPVHVECLPDGSQCQGDGKYAANGGFLYFVANASTVFPFLQLSSTGINTAVTYTPPKKDAEKPAQPAAVTAPVNLPEALNASPQVKRLFSIQAVQ